MRSQPQNGHILAVGFITTAETRDRLSALLGEAWTAVDIRHAPPTADVVLVGHCSPQLVIRLRREFPHARVMVAELAGAPQGPDICRCLSAGAAGHLAVHGVAELAAALDAASRQPLAA